MVQTTARLKRGGKHYEILIDFDAAMKVRIDAPGASLNSALVTEVIFYDLKSGAQASKADLEVDFGTSNIMEVAKKIIKSGEIEKPVEAVRADQDKKYKQVVEFFRKNAISPEGRPYTADRIMKALSEAHVNVKNKPIESQVQEILDQLSKILPSSQTVCEAM